MARRELTKMTMNLVPNAKKALDELADRTGNDKTDVVNQALNLYNELHKDQAEGTILLQRAPDGTLTRIRLF